MCGLGRNFGFVVREVICILLKDVDCPDGCPLYKEEICPGGMRCYGGEPIEPPCCSMDDEEDLNSWIDNYYDGQRRYEEYLDRQEEKCKLKEHKNEVLRRKRQYTRSFCYSEIQTIKRIKKQIKSYKSAKSFARSLTFAFNTTNEMFGYEERKVVNPQIDEELSRLELQLKEAECALVKKRKEAHKTDAYLAIK